MGNNRKFPNSGLSNKIEDYLKARIGQTIEQQELRKDLKIGDTPISTKISHLKKQGRIKYDYSMKPIGIIVLPSMSDHVNRGGHRIPSPKTLIPTSQALSNELNIQAVLDAPPLDVAGHMHHFTQVDQQVRIYRNALEQIALILEQARIIETQK